MKLLIKINFFIVYKIDFSLHLFLMNYSQADYLKLNKCKQNIAKYKFLQNQYSMANIILVT